MSFQLPTRIGDLIVTSVVFVLCLYGIIFEEMPIKIISSIWIIFCGFSFYSIYVEWKEGR